MMSTPTTVHTISARRLHSSIAIGSALLIVAAIAIVLLLRSPSGAIPAARSIPAAVDSSASLDQHERHPAVTTDRSAPLDQHERHPDLFAPKAEHAALLDALDRYLAARNR
jgi:uncharacterized protein YfaA (DUF2138 family)